MAIRFIDMEKTPAVRSQAVYHAVARARTEESPDTVLLVTPAEPYVCIGYHQEASREVDLEYCKKHRIPIVRREVGGGVVYLDQNQLFIQWVFQPGRLPWRVEHRFRLFAEPLIRTYRALGLEAYFRPPNDIHVAGKKIAGLGAGAIGKSEVVVGNILFDFDFERMSKVLNVPGVEFRRILYESLRQYLTTVGHERAEIPHLKTVQKIYLSECERVLKDRIIAGDFTGREWKMIERLDTRFASESWWNRRGGLNRPGIKIHSDVWLYRNRQEVNGGNISAILRVRGGRVDDVLLSSSMDLSSPDGVWKGLERAIRNTELTHSKLAETIGNFYRSAAIPTPHVRAEDWIHVLLKHRDRLQEA